jgi:hypothetical protein
MRVGNSVLEKPLADFRKTAGRQNPQSGRRHLISALHGIGGVNVLKPLIKPGDKRLGIIE